MTKLLDDLSVEIEIVEIPAGTSKCLICGNEIIGYRLYCQSRRCFHEYERKMGAYHASKLYRESMYWHTYDLMHITFEHFESIDEYPR